MILAFHLADIIQVPFGYLMEALYRVTGNYGFALMLFAVIVQLVLLPITAKSKKSMMKMSRLTPLAQDIQRRYADDPARQNQAIQELYQKEGVSMGGGCLWSFVPMLLLLPLYTVVRQPIVYMLHENLDVANQIIEVIKQAQPELFAGNAYYHQGCDSRHWRDGPGRHQLRLHGHRPGCRAPVQCVCRYLGLELGPHRLSADCSGLRRLPGGVHAHHAEAE